MSAPPTPTATPILLFNDECGVCRRIAAWVTRSMAREPARLVVRPIGDDPAALRALHPGLDIWAAYATIHMLMPDGTMKLGGEAVAEVLRRLPNTRWFAGCLAWGIGRFRPAQLVLNLGYLILADTRPLFGCESCGTPAPWLRPFIWIGRSLRSLVGGHARVTHHASRIVRPGAPHAGPR